MHSEFYGRSFSAFLPPLGNPFSLDCCPRILSLFSRFLALTFFSCMCCGKIGILSIFFLRQLVCGFSAKIIKSGPGPSTHTNTHTETLKDSERREGFPSDAALHLFCLCQDRRRTGRSGGSSQKIACQVKLLVCQRETG